MKAYIQDFKITKLRKNREIERLLDSLSCYMTEKEKKRCLKLVDKSRTRELHNDKLQNI